MRKLFTVTMLTLMVFSLFGCKTDKSGAKLSDVSVEHGEDYRDGRESKWILRKNDDSKIATIKAAKGYVLSNQMDFQCDILKQEEQEKEKETSEIKVATISTCPDATVDDVKEAFKGKYKSFDAKDEKGYSYIKVSDGENNEEYCVVGNKSNSVVIELFNSSGKVTDEVINDIVSMVSI